MKLKDNKIFRLISIPICIILCLFGKFIPLGSLSQDASGVVFIFLACLFLWLTIGIDWPSILCIFSLGLLKSLKFNTVLSSAFGNSTFIFLLFTFICTYALSKTSLIRRIAIEFINFKLARKSGYWFIFLFLLSVLILGLFISPSVLFVVILPILYEIFDLAHIEKGDKVAKVLMMGLGFTVSISSGMTTIAHVFPVLAISSAKLSVTPFEYMAIGIPVGIIVFLIMFLLFRLILKPDVDKLKNADVSHLKESLPPINKTDIITLSIFIIVILLWIIPSFIPKSDSAFYLFISDKLGTAMPPILGTIALCIIRIDGKPILSVDEAFKKGVPWTSLIMCAGTLALSSALTNDAIGIKDFLSNNIGPHMSGLPAIALLIIFTIWAALQTNVSSNMVTATLVSTVAFSIIPNTSSSICLTAVIILIGLLASYAFATPPSMPHIAIVAGSEYCTTKDVLIFGSIMMIVSVIISLLVGYPLGLLIF